MFILHHYSMSPFSEKLRLMLGYADVPWQSLPSPEMPPRPNVDPLSGGYRRIPIAQIGADIFCDSRLISAEIARESGKAALDPNHATNAERDYAATLEGDVFWGAVMSIGAGRTLKQLVRNVGVWKTLRFIKDRAGVGRTAKVVMPSARQAGEGFVQHLKDMEQRLQDGFLSGTSQPSHLDFAAYHTLWFQRAIGKVPMALTLPRVEAWYATMTGFGHGAVQAIKQQQAFDVATKATPREIPKDQTQDALIGVMVTIAPNDYALNGVVGTLVGCSAERWIVARETERFGLLHVHFPRLGFDLSESVKVS